MKVTLKSVPSIVEKNTKTYFGCCVLLLLLIWYLYGIFVVTFLKPNYPFIYDAVRDIVRVMIWTIPVFFCLKIEGIDVLDFLKLKGNIRSGIRWGLLGSGIVVVYQLLIGLLSLKSFTFNIFFEFHVWVSFVLLIGFAEEIPFRGFFLQKMAGYMNFGLANICTSLLFVLIHAPSFGLYTLLGTFVFSMFQGYVLKKSNSLWACILIHSVNNFMAFSIYSTVNFPLK